MKILNLLTSGGIGGIEVLCKDIGQNSRLENGFCFMYGEGTVFDQMKAQGQNVYSQRYSSKLSWRRFASLRSLAEPYDVIVVHHDDPFLEMHYLFLKLVFPRKKFVSIVHHCYDPEGDAQEYGFLKRMLKKYIVTRMFKKSDKILFVSKAGYRSYIPAYKIPENKVEIVYNGIGVEKLEAGRQSETPAHDGVRLLYAGRLAKLKGVHQLLHAFAALETTYPVTLTVVGDGPERSALEELTRQLGLVEKVHFVGFQQDVKPYLAQADVFIYPSRTEIFGISLVEAMAFGNICVANNVGGIPEIISDGENGFLNVSNTQQGLTKTVERAIQALADDEQRVRLQDNARQTAQKFSIETTIRKLEEVYCAVFDK